LTLKIKGLSFSSRTDGIKALLNSVGDGASSLLISADIFVWFIATFPKSNST